jgi:transposase
MVPPRRSPIESQSDGGIERSRARACSSIIEHHGEQYAGIDVSLESVSVCVVDAVGRVVREAKAECEPEPLIAWSGKLGVSMARLGLEAGLLVELLETRHVRDAFKAMPVKTDRTDARVSRN